MVPVTSERPVETTSVGEPKTSNRTAPQEGAASATIALATRSTGRQVLQSSSRSPRSMASPFVEYGLRTPRPGAWALGGESEGRYGDPENGTESRTRIW